MNEISLIGASGFVGSAIYKMAQEMGVGIRIFSREDREAFLSKSHKNVIYCAGENVCDKKSIVNLVDANSFYLAEIISKQNFEHLTYFSSTRVYGTSNMTGESSDIVVSPNDARNSFVASKLLSESICQFSDKPVLILRPSNIYGFAKSSKLFLPSIIRNALIEGLITMYVPKSYSKDYISVGDVARYTLKLARKQVTGIFNLAAGVNISAEDISSILVKETGCSVKWVDGAVAEEFAAIDITKVTNTIPDYETSRLEDGLVDLIDTYRKHL